MTARRSAHPAIIGLGLTEMSLRPGASAAELAAQALHSAITDADLAPAQIDGLLVGSSQGVRPDRVGVTLAAQAGLGDLRLLEHVEIKGATTVAMVQRATDAVREGRARSVACVFADAPLRPTGTAGSTYAHSGGTSGVRGLERASGVLGSVPTYALLAARWLSVTGGSAADLCAVAVSARQWAVGNPAAVQRRPLGADAYYASPMVSTPLRRLDCARPVNGAAAVVISAEPAAAGTPAVRVLGTGRAHPIRRRRAGAESWFGGGRTAVDDALAEAGLERGDLDLLELYDPFSVVTLCLLEEYGFCPPGRAGAMAREGALAPGGSLPTNTGGGQLSGFYLQGMTPLVEAVVQLRGTGGARQVPDAGTAFVGGLGGRSDHHAALILEAA
ncbi:thiolase family protein [Cryptosporangium aurantiacum]|uniref:Acetyl-CoA acetyltransferase n=1 Tax=Cryptosporangium aurantiacum TaxID=134849 RepID=A0A1M7PKT8_9ACTN|nr:thiolase family protein [Cryptosporangium aurantiacum]SHN17626.1 Acetyl-CoA acetyltransferase [Cryptosporangium aurantiacum]